MDAAILVQKVKSHLLNVVILGAALFFAARIYQSQEVQRASLMRQKAQELQKNTVLMDISRQEKKLKAYHKLFATSPSAVINSISEYADQNGIRISSLRPGQEQTSDIFMKYPFEMAISANGYHALGKFISALENSKDIFLIESLSFKPQGNVAKGEKRVRLDAAIRLSALALQE